MAKERITCHILDTARGRPAASVRVRLERTAASPAPQVFESQTNDDGRVTAWLPFSASNDSGDVPVYTLEDVMGKAEAEAAAAAGTAAPAPTTWTLRFDIEGYYGAEAFFPEVAVTFRVAPGQHYHVPLLLSPFSYTTYRGS